MRVETIRAQLARPAFISLFQKEALYQSLKSWYKGAELQNDALSHVRDTAEEARAVLESIRAALDLFIKLDAPVGRAIMIGIDPDAENVCRQMLSTHFNVSLHPCAANHNQREE